jgi:hypothetical protein
VTGESKQPARSYCQASPAPLAFRSRLQHLKQRLNEAQAEPARHNAAKEALHAVSELIDLLLTPR